jgi:tripartite-type tricarboxylate transporter receptor subunit TctC
MVPASPSAWSTQPPHPQRHITLVVGYAAGGATDTVARLIAHSMEEGLGQQFKIENKSGASSNYGAEYAARSEPDGHTLYIGTIANAINRTLYRGLKYDFVKDFLPIGRIAEVTNVLVVHDRVPVDTSLPYIRAGKLRAISLTSESTTSFAPGIPAIVRAGLPGFDIHAWFGMMAPAGTPPEVVARLNASLNNALASPAVRQAYAQRGFAAPGGDNSPEAFQRFIGAEIDKWGTVIRAANLSAE